MARHEDDDLDFRLRKDAREVRAEISPQLRSRIQASLHSAEQVRSVPVQHDSPGNYGWASALTGIAAALMILVLLNWNRDIDVSSPSEQTATTITPEISERLGAMPLKARTADLTGPLEEELMHLQSDIEKARARVERDLRMAL